MREPGKEITIAPESKARRPFDALSHPQLHFLTLGNAQKRTLWPLAET